MPFSRPHPYFGLEKNHLKQTINKWEDNGEASHLQNTLGEQQAKVLLSESPKLAMTRLPGHKEDLGLLAEFLTDHAALKYYLYKFRKGKDQICRPIDLCT